MRAYQADYPVTKMCRILGVSVSGYYAWRKRPPSRRQQTDILIGDQIEAFYRKSRSPYGRPRIHQDLREAGVAISSKRVARLMQERRLYGASRRKFTVTTVRDRDAKPAPDLVERKFRADAPDQLWLFGGENFIAHDGYHLRRSTRVPLARYSHRGSTMIVYLESAEHIDAEALSGGFFAGWLRAPSTATHVRLLRSSDHIVLAIDDDTGRVVGFVTAISDGVLSAYITFLEVLPAYRRRKVGTTLLERLLNQLRSLYMIDVVCDEQLRSFYERFEMQTGTAMMLRRYDRQTGE